MTKNTKGNGFAIQTLGISRTFGNFVAVDGVDLSVKEGELFSLLGPNGAGKTTTIKMLCCLLRPSSGTATIMGHDVQKDPIAVKQVIDVSPQETAIAEHLNARENLSLMGGIHGLEKEEVKKRSEELLEMMGLTNRAKERVKKYSGGMKRRLSITMALVSDPQVLFLDEPTLGLDRQSRRGIWEHIAELKGKKTIVLTTHYLEEADALADRIAIIDEGKIVALGTPQELKDGISDMQVMVVKAKNLNKDAIDVLMAWEESSLLGEDAILGIEGDWIDPGWAMVDVLAKDWRWGGAWWFDKNGWSGWLTYSSLNDFIAAGGFGPSDDGNPCTIDPTDSVMLLAMAGCNPDGDLYIDDISMNGVTYDFEPPPVIEVEVDIKPGSDPNSINPKGKGVIPVAILGSDTFDVTDVDVETLEFGPDKATPVHDLTDPDVYAEHLQDVNGDTFTDLVSHYRTQDTGIAQGDTDATLTGQTTGGILIAGTDSVRTVGKP